MQKKTQYSYQTQVVIRYKENPTEENLEKVFRVYWKLVDSIARKMSSPLLHEDRIQEGMIGLLGAVRQYDPERGCEFSTLCTYHVRCAILRAARDRGRLVKVPAHIQALYTRIQKWQLDNMREGTVEELCAATGATVQSVESALVLEQYNTHAPIEVVPESLHCEKKGDGFSSLNDNELSLILNYLQIAEDCVDAYTFSKKARVPLHKAETIYRALTRYLEHRGSVPVE